MSEPGVTITAGSSKESQTRLPGIEASAGHMLNAKNWLKPRIQRDRRFFWGEWNA